MTDDTAATIRAARLAHDVSQHALAEAVGVSKSYLSHIEAGRRAASDHLLDRVREALQAVPAAAHAKTYWISVGSDHTAPRAEIGVSAVNPAAALRAAAELPASAWTSGGGW